LFIESIVVVGWWWVHMRKRKRGKDRDLAVESTCKMAMAGMADMAMAVPAIPPF
jgi:hypothetical protein